MSASTTPSGSEPPANGAPTMIENATAAAGAMWVMDWNSTSRSPIAERASPCEDPDDPTAAMLAPLPEDDGSCRSIIARSLYSNNHLPGVPALLREASLG